MKIIDMRRAEMDGNMKAFFKVETEDGFVIDGFKVMNGKNGLFASVPSKKINEKFIETVSAPRHIRDELSRLAIDLYNQLPPPSGGSPATGGRPTSASESVDLPF